MSKVVYNTEAIKEEEKMTPKLKEVVDFFIVKSAEEKIPLTNKKLQKLIYYAQAWNLVFNNKPLFDDTIEAWIHGPVVPSVYRIYKKYGREEITEKVSFDKKLFTKEELETLDEVWETYGKFDGDYLEILSHSEDPWSIARGDAELREKSSSEISQSIMKDYYSNKLKLAMAD